MRFKILIFILPIYLLADATDDFLLTLPYNKGSVKKIDTKTLKRVDKVLVIKSKSRIYLISKGKRVKDYRISLGKNPEGHKFKEGDQKTPEGNYTLDYKKKNSTFHRAIHISYPNSIDRAKAKKAGVSAGGFIMIHGQTAGELDWFSTWAIRFFNWTDGCIAVTNDEIDEIYSLVKIGTPIEIRP
ncbi:MAG: L,D-transpeptidase family protein [Sulfurovum sp.]|nr:L,D-transpeptidase family protein [Sulfurovaceae bacterium]